jgi:hypothetical protein
MAAQPEDKRFQMDMTVKMTITAGSKQEAEESATAFALAATDVFFQEGTRHTVEVPLKMMIGAESASEAKRAIRDRLKEAAGALDYPSPTVVFDVEEKKPAGGVKPKPSNGSKKAVAVKKKPSRK